MAVEIKICGLTGPEDIEAVNAAGADYAGFVLYEPSKRYVSLADACALKEGLAPGIRSVAVCVSPEEEAVSRIDAAGFERIQIHGSVTPDLLASLRTPVWQAINLSDPAQLEQILLHPRIDGYLIDGAAFGGGETFGWERVAGDPAENAEQVADVPTDDAEQSVRVERLREEIRARADGRRFILAGGLNADNVREGIRLFAPDIVDVSSGVEWSTADAAGGGDRRDPAAGVAGGGVRTESTAGVRGGRKDPEKLMAFVREVREA